MDNKWETCTLKFPSASRGEFLGIAEEFIVTPQEADQIRKLRAIALSKINKAPKG